MKNIKTFEQYEEQSDVRFKVMKQLDEPIPAKWGRSFFPEVGHTFLAAEYEPGYVTIYDEVGKGVEVMSIEGSLFSQYVPDIFRPISNVRQGKSLIPD
jgi:hypothetical protein